VERNVEPEVTLSRRRLLQIGGTLPAIVQARGASSFRDVPKAMWVWKDRILAPDDLHRFATVHNIGTLFLYVTPTAATALLGGDRPATEVARRLADGRRLYAMAGEPEWALQRIVPRHVNLLLRLQKLRPRIFDGVHLDVEPNALAEWADTSARPQIAEQTMAFFEAVRNAASDVAIDAALNPVLANVVTRQGGSLLSAVASRVQSISLMAYRNKADRAIAWSAEAMRDLRAAGKAWRMGIEVEANDDEPGTSWHATPALAFEHAMSAFHAQLRVHPYCVRYAGLALHSFDGLRQKLA
jgi:hypothetical protein